jgi:hypothetical protein
VLTADGDLQLIIGAEPAPYGRFKCGTLFLLGSDRPLSGS